MKTYIFLTKLTDAGATAVYETPSRIDQLTLDWQALAGEGGQVVAFYTTAGEYDHVIVATAAGDDAAAEFVLFLARQGQMRTVTLRAFDKAEVESLIAVARAHR